MMRRAILLQFILLVFGLLPLTGWAETYTVKEISHLEINSAITPATYDYLQLHFKHIPAGALILIKLNTPGGLVTTTKDIITLIGTQDKPVVIWITPEGASASSAGAIIASSAHFILMSSGTSMGAATPVGLGEDIKEGDGKSKALNDLKAMVRSLSESRNRPAGPFEEMIETAKSYTDQEALKAKIIDGVLSKESSLRDILNGKNFTVMGKKQVLDIPVGTLSKAYEPTLGQIILNVLANPTTAYLLFLAGIALLYFEMQAPGGFVAGGIGITLVLLAAISFQVLPLHWGALALLVLGLVLIVLEFYISSYGLLAVGGVISMAVGSLFLFHGEGGFISVNYPILVSILLAVLVSIAFLVWYLIHDKKKQQVNQEFFLPIGAAGMVVAKIEGSPSTYQVKVRGEIWKAVAPSQLEVGDSIKVTSIDPQKLIAQIKKTDKE